MISDAFPFGGGEQFIFPEVDGWHNDTRFELVIAPLSTRGVRRGVPESIRVIPDLSFDENSRFWGFILSLFSLAFWLNLKLLRKAMSQESLFWSKVFILKRYVVSALVSSRLQALQSREGFDCIYSYWASIGTLALLFSDKIDPNIFRIARAHRYDLYAERSWLGYIPFQTEALNALDELHCISQEGADYAQVQYSLPFNKVLVSRLGVEVPDTLSHHVVSDRFEIVSCSFVTEIKRVDMIIDAVAIAAASVQRPIRWTHIGSGPLLDDIKEWAKVRLANIDVEFEFLGLLENSEVQNLYKSKCFDCFVNFSAHEGVPVSIMEAQAHGIPAIAPDVGGVATLFTEDDWRLMPADAEPADMACRLVRIAQMGVSANRDLRSEAFELAKSRFSATVNYKKFRDHIALQIRHRQGGGQQRPVRPKTSE